MLRIALAVAILAGVAGLGLSFKVSEKITGLNANIETLTGEKQAAEDAQGKAEKEAKTAKEVAEKATKEMTNTKEALAKAQSDADQQNRRANSLNDALNKANTEKTEAQQSLSAWRATDVTPDQIRTMKADLAKAQESIEASAEEKKILLRNNNLLKTELSRYTGDNERVVLPYGLKGKVLLVDPKHDFVVLDIGSTQGALERGEMLVNRGGRMVAKIRITNVEANRSIANVLAEFKQAEVMEGDQVLR